MKHLMTPVQEATKTWHWNCASARSQRALRGGLFCAGACTDQAQQSRRLTSSIPICQSRPD